MSGLAGHPTRDSGDTRGKGPADVETQLADLQRKYRILEVNRKAYCEDAQTIIRRQRAAIEKLQEENGNLKHELDVSEETGAPNMTVQQELQRLREAAVTFTRKIEAEKKRVESLDSQIHAYDAKAMDKRRTMGGVNAAKDDTQQVSKHIHLLENKVEAALIKLNEAVGRNKLLRESIDNLRLERVVFDQVYRKIERELHDKKREMAGVIDITNIAHEARDQAKNEAAALRAQNDKEQAAFDAEYREVGRLIEDDRRAREQALKAEAEKIYEFGHQEAEQNKKLKGHWPASREKKADPVAKPAMSSDEAFARIQAATGITQVEELVATFVSAEEQNFSMFNYVNELNQEAEKLEEQAVELQRELQRSRSATADEDSMRQQLVMSQQEKHAAMEARSAALDVKFAAAMQAMEGLKASIGKIFEDTGCNTAATRELLGDLGVSESNVLQYMALIEQRSSEILSHYLQKLARGGIPAVQAEPSEARSIYTQQGIKGASAAGAINIEPPSAAEAFELSDDSSEDEEDDRPLTREELAARTAKKLAAAAAKGGRGRRRK